MGFFAAMFSIIIVIIQTTSILMNRKAHEWTFPLLEATPNTTYLSQINNMFLGGNTSALDNRYYFFSDSNVLDDMIFNNKSQPHNYHRQLDSSIDMYLFNSTLSSKNQAVCIRTAWANGGHSFPTHCLMNTHMRQNINSILQSLNPHLLLLTICTIHAIMCISKLQKSIVWTKNEYSSAIEYGLQNQQVGIEHPRSISLPMSASFLIVLLIIVYIIEGTKTSSTQLVQYPTIVLTIFFLFQIAYFIYKHISQQKSISSQKENFLFFNICHLQCVAIPTAVLSITIVGARFWTDVLYSVVLLVVASHAFYISNESSDIISKKLSQMIYIASPTLCLYLAFMEWGGFDNWRYVIGLMGCTCLTPFFYFPFFLMTAYLDAEQKEKKLKYLSKISLLTSSAALMSLVVNLGMFYDIDHKNQEIALNMNIFNKSH